MKRFKQYCYLDDNFKGLELERMEEERRIKRGDIYALY